MHEGRKWRPKAKEIALLFEVRGFYGVGGWVWVGVGGHGLVTWA